MKLSWYNRRGQFKNGVKWARHKTGWGLWWVDRKASMYLTDINGNSSPWSPLVLLRLPRYTVAILHPEGDNL